MEVEGKKTVDLSCVFFGEVVGGWGGGSEIKGGWQARRRGSMLLKWRNTTE